MAFLTVHFSSKAINKASAFNIILPDGVEHPGPYPVLYQLHGLSDDYSAWSRRTSIERYVSELPLIVVMPDTHRGWYTDAVDGYAYESHIIEVVNYVDRNFRTIPERKGRVIGGLSMGGYGSMKLALKHPDKFCSVASHSSAFGVTRREREDNNFNTEITRIFGKNPKDGPNDVFALAENIEKENLPKIRFDCGTEDKLLNDNVKFHEHLEKIGVPHEFETFPGRHNWDYWDIHIREALEFHWKSLGPVMEA